MRGKETSNEPDLKNGKKEQYDDDNNNNDGNKDGKRETKMKI